MSFLNELPPRWAANFSEWIVVHGAPSGVYLTFDDGPDPKTTPRFLDALNALDCKATFFLLGTNVEKYPAIVHSIVTAGHAIGIHGYNHQSWLLKPASWVEEEIIRCRSVLFDAAGVTPSICRPPYGRIGPGALKAARELNIPFVLWSICPDDWNPMPLSDLVTRAADKAIDRDILLFHDSGRGAETTLAALPEIIVQLRAKGHQPKPLISVRTVRNTVIPATTS